MAEHTPIDSVTGTATTGHEWDGIRELNTPLPRWWLWTLYLTVAWAVAYWVVYPAWPLVSSFTTGVFNWNSRAAVVSELNDLKSLRAPMNTRLAATALGDIKTDQALADFTYAQGRARIADRVTVRAAAAPRAIPT
jgi:cytochrome c oxidase cbb3-type subunit 3